MEKKVKRLRLMNASWDADENVVLGIEVTLPQKVICKRVALDICNDIAYILNAEVHGETINIVSDWLNKNGFEEASKAINCEFEL